MDGRTDGQTDGRTDDAKTISLRLRRGIINNTRYFNLLNCRNPQKGTLANGEDPDEMLDNANFIKVCIVCLDKITIFREIQYFLKTISSDPS